MQALSSLRKLLAAARGKKTSAKNKQIQPGVFKLQYFYALVLSKIPPKSLNSSAGNYGSGFTS